MIPEKAIRLAEQGGWYNEVDCGYALYRGIWQFAALSPDFWQALGKALEWTRDTTQEGSFASTAWLRYAHRFYDLILTGGDIEKYWQEILTAN